MERIQEWHRKRQGRLAFGVVELALSYGFASLSIDSGNLWYYLLTLVTFIGGVANLIKLVGSFINGSHKTN